MKNLCDICTHNIAADKPKHMDCEYACTGVKKIKNGGEKVTECEDYNSPR